MMRRLAVRAAQMDAAEFMWRTKTFARSTLQRAAAAFRTPTWNRRRLAARLAPTRTLDAARRALKAGDWDQAHAILSRHIVNRSSRFAIHPHDRSERSARIARAFPNAPNEAAWRADRILDGRYDLLGYRNLVFTHGRSSVDGADRRQRDSPLAIDWQFDPVHDRRPPQRFWTTVPYLDAACGDHKIIWELNRHQHWLGLGRAYWLTGAPAYRQHCLDELASWLQANPPLIGINWASMLELAFRSLSWIWALHFFACPDAGKAAAPERPWIVDLLLGLDRQLTHIEQNLSYYFSPNTHLLGEALALYVAGRSVPELARAEQRATLGRRILLAETARQIASDGGHCERSTHYHRYALDFYLLALVIARVTHDPAAAAFERAVARLGSAARLLADESGRAPHIGDDDGGMLLPIAGREADDWRDSLGLAAALTDDDSLRIGAPTEEELWMLKTVPRARELTAIHRSAALPATGYYVSHSPRNLHLVIDGGPHGFRNAGHAHADALALTLSVRGRPLLIDAGTGCYTIAPAVRDRFRATAAHNTVVLNGRSQSTPAGAFHWISTADATTHRWRGTDAFDYFDGAHDGYAPLRHRRRAFVLHPNLVVVADHISGTGNAIADVHWHVDRAWSVDVRHRAVTMRCGDENASLIVPGGSLRLFEGDDETGLGWHAPVYGQIEPAATIALTHQGSAPFWMASIFDFSASNAAREATWLPVWAEAGVLSHAAAMRIDHEASTDYLLIAEPVDPASTATWRTAEFETDARFAFGRMRRDGGLQCVALVDASIFRASGRKPFGFSLGRRVPAVFIDESSIRTFTPCAVSPAL